MKSLIVAAFCVGPLFADSSSIRLYWTDKDDGQIKSSDLDGGNRVTLLSGLNDPRGIAVDPSQDKMFWASHEANGAIYWANCDGSEAEVFIASLSEPADLLLDLENRMIYWAAEGGGLIQRADLDESRQVNTVVSGLDRPYYLALDGGFVYWSYFNSSVIERASAADGSNRSLVISGQQRVRDIEIADGVIYWCDRNSNQLRRRDLDGAGGGTVLFTGGILDRPHGLVLDPLTNTMFWTDTETELIGSSAMDGSGIPATLVSSSLTGPWAIDLVRPTPPGEPYEAWQRDHFSDEDLNDPLKEATVWGGSADPDRDGSSNMMEYAQGTNPNLGVVPPGTVAVVRGAKFQVIFRMRADDPELSFVLESTADLSADVWDGEDFEEVGQRVPDPGDSAYELITMETERAGIPRHFARLSVNR